MKALTPNFNEINVDAVVITTVLGEVVHLRSVIDDTVAFALAEAGEDADDISPERWSLIAQSSSDDSFAFVGDKAQIITQEKTISLGKVISVTTDDKSWVGLTV